MSWVEQVRMTYAYNEWASEKVIAAAAQVSDTDLAAERTGSKGSIAADLAHIVSTQQGWFSMIAGEEPPPRWNPPTEDVIPTLRQHFDASHGRLRNYTDGLTDEELERKITTEWQGQSFTYAPWQVLTHLANHSTQHRSEVGIALLGLGASPGDIDVIFYIDEVKAGR